MYPSPRSVEELRQYLRLSRIGDIDQCDPEAETRALHGDGSEISLDFDIDCWPRRLHFRDDVHMLRRRDVDDVQPVRVGSDIGVISGHEQVSCSQWPRSGWHLLREFVVSGELQSTGELDIERLIAEGRLKEPRGEPVQLAFMGGFCLYRRVCQQEEGGQYRRQSKGEFSHTGLIGCEPPLRRRSRERVPLNPDVTPV